VDKKLARTCISCFEEEEQQQQQEKKKTIGPETMSFGSVKIVTLPDPLAQTQV